MPDFNDAKTFGGSAKEDPHACGGERVGPLKKTLTRAGGRGGGRLQANLSQLNTPGGSAKEDPHACGGEREGDGEGSGRSWEVQI